MITFNSISAMFSQLPSLGVWTKSKRSHSFLLAVEEKSHTKTPAYSFLQQRIQPIHSLRCCHIGRGRVSFALQAGFGLKCRCDPDKNLSKVPITLSYDARQVKNCKNQ